MSTEQAPLTAFDSAPDPEQPEGLAAVMDDVTGTTEIVERQRADGDRVAPGEEVDLRDGLDGALDSQDARGEDQ